MYISFNERWIPDREDVLPVEDNLHHNVQLSDSIYYYRYPYRITFTNQAAGLSDRKERRTAVAMFRIELETFSEDFIQHPPRFYISAKSQRMYVRKLEDLEAVINMFGSIIDSVAGPYSEEHIDMLLNRDYHVAVREPYYGEYDCKVYALQQRDSYASYLASNSTVESRKATMNEVRSFLSDNYGHKVKLLPSIFAGLDFYINQEDLLQAMPFLKLQFPEVRYMITKCIQK